MAATTILSPTDEIEIPEVVRSARGRKPGQTCAVVPKSSGVLIVPVPLKERLAGLAKGADPRGYRDRA
ncbi:AbrB/MazE/SpoVT family DNA-binding domain-containing protein [Salinarimonas sp.]|uniref:AbrB/MazE/SpoVT family DNA-binding domain-containing protein n=1 Tax=Salinarimonas sp. TaxID=2766526 RepID=UPI00391B318D